MLVLKMIRHSGDMRIVEVENVEVRNRGSSSVEVEYVTTHDHERWTTLVSKEQVYGPEKYEMIVVESSGKTSEIIRPYLNNS